MEEHSRPILAVREGELAGREIEISGDSLLIGRTPDTNWRIHSPKISRHHARVYWQAGRWWIEDLGSKNGTFVNEKRIQEPVALSGGDTIQLAGLLAFEFCDPEATLAETSTQILRRGIWVDTKKREVFINNRLLNPPLSPQLYNLLKALWQERGKVVDNKLLIRVLWPDASDDPISDLNNRETLDHYCSNLAARLRQADHSHEYIQTVRGRGRMLAQRTR